MSEKIVLTSEELQLLRTSQQQIDFLTRRFGELHFQIKYANQELSSVESTMEQLMEDRTKIMQTIQEKYGAGTLDLSTGELEKVSSN